MRALLALSLILAGCHAPVCSMLATRCRGAVAEVCASDGQWDAIADCATIGGECAALEDVEGEVHACVPVTP